MKTEPVFNILAEGGGICIIRQRDDQGEKFIYHHNEFDPTGEGLDVNKNDEYDNFEQPFQLINNRYNWYMLWLEAVHDDYRSYIIEELIKNLNKKSITSEYLDHNKHHIEDSLKIKFHYRYDQHTNNLIWSCEKTE